MLQQQDYSTSRQSVIDNTSDGWNYQTKALGTSAGDESTSGGEGGICWES